MHADPRPARPTRPLLLALLAVLVAAVGAVALPGPVAAAAGDANIVPLVPARLLETRTSPGLSTIDGRHLRTGRVAAGGIYELDVTGRGGVADDAVAVMLNVTAVRPDGKGFITVFPCTPRVPNSSNVNYVAGDIAPNSVVAKLSEDGRVCLYTYAGTDMIVDVTGYVPIGGAPIPLDPARLVESRRLPGNVTVDGQYEGIGRVSAGTTTKFRVRGRAGVPDEAEAVHLNVTAINPDARGFLTVFPCTSSVPTTSNVNYVAGATAPNAVLATVSTDGFVCIYTSASTDLIADVAAYLPPGGGRVSIEPARCADTRPNGETFDGRFEGDGKISAGGVYAVTIAGRCNIGADASAAYLNVTAVNPDASGFLTVWPCDEPRPDTSNVNYVPGSTQPNGVLSKITLDGKGQVCIYSFARTDVVVDANGYVPAPGLVGIDELAPGIDHGCALLDTGAVWCWGEAGRTGDGTYERRSAPRPSAITNAVALSSGSYHSCAILPARTAACWGDNDRAQLGDGTDDGDPVGATTRRLSPVAVRNLTGVIDIDGGYRHTCAVTDGVDADSAGDTVWCWGLDTAGEVGPSATPGVEYPVPRQVGGLPSGVSVVQVEAGDGVSCARLADGSVWCWGNSSRTGGSGSSGPAAVVGLSDAVDVAPAQGTGNGSHVCALRAGGSVLCWGGGTSGQLGDGTALNRSTPVTVIGISNAVAVSTATSTSCAALADGSARCWGANTYGQTGDGSPSTGGRTTPVVVKGAGAAIESMEAGGTYSCAVLDDGRGVCWGGSTTWPLGNDVEPPAVDPVVIGGRS